MCSSYRKYKFKEERVEIDNSKIINSLLEDLSNANDISNYIKGKNDPEKYDHFNALRIINPILEIASKIEFANENKDSMIFLLEKLGIPEPEIFFYMFRHGLAHGLRPFKVQNDKDLKKDWAISYSGKHFNGEYSMGPNVIKLYEDLKSYLESINNSEKIRGGKTKIQIGVIIFEKKLK